MCEYILTLNQFSFAKVIYHLVINIFVEFV